MRTGNLRFRFLEENNAYKNNTRIYYRYSIEATATNVAGETQSSADVIAAGNRSLILQTELKEKTCKNQPFNTVFKVQNLNGQPVEVKVHSPLSGERCGLQATGRESGCNRYIYFQRRNDD